MIRNFIMALTVGFVLGLGAVVYFLGPKGVRAEVCRGYVENAKPLALSRAEKKSYLDSFRTTPKLAVNDLTAKASEKTKRPHKVRKQSLKAIPSKKRLSVIRESRKTASDKNS